MTTFTESKNPLIDNALIRNIMEEINLSVSKNSQPFLTLAQLAQPIDITRQLANQAIVEPSADARTQGAYLINQLSWRLVSIVCFLDLCQLSLDALWNGRIGVLDAWRFSDLDGETPPYTTYEWHLDELKPCSQPLAAEQLGKQLIEIMTPFIAEVHHQTRFSQAAQWRLLTDSITAVYLHAGKLFNTVEEAKTRASDIIESTGKPLANAQWHFKEFNVSAQSSPTGETLKEWFRIRGGCCRYYTTEAGRYCSTCVHLDENEQQQRFENYLITLAVNAAPN